MPAEDLQQRRFARAVAADQASALVRRDQPVSVFKEEFLAESFAGGGELQHAPSIFSLLSAENVYPVTTSRH